MAALERRFQEIKPRLARESLKQDPAEFERKFQTVRRIMQVEE
jgi:hypothetical protein